MYLEKLIIRLKNYGLYSGKTNLLILKLEGGFEEFYGRASETWEHRFSLEIGEIRFDKCIFPGYKIIGGKSDRNWDNLAEKALIFLDSWFSEINKNND